MSELFFFFFQKSKGGKKIKQPACGCKKPATLAPACAAYQHTRITSHHTPCRCPLRRALASSMLGCITEFADAAASPDQLN
uniref:Uncharacterized protein n=1 Tax=Oryza sativa subsp. japonica TaxID=39947 RepID=Q651X3_ORYSJ|nr:hypothetical protein [Oryza sativa Japonica Group]